MGLFDLEGLVEPISKAINERTAEATQPVVERLDRIEDLLTQILAVLELLQQG